MLTSLELMIPTGLEESSLSSRRPTLNEDDLDELLASDEPTSSFFSVEVRRNGQARSGEVCKVSWRKGVVEVSAPRLFVVGVAKAALAAGHEAWVSVRDLRKPAGKVGWGASISLVPWSQIAPLWVACADPERGEYQKSRTSFVAAGTVTVAPALTCVVALFSASSANPTRLHVSGSRRTRWLMSVDPSPRWLVRSGLMKDLPSNTWLQSGQTRIASACSRRRCSCRGLTSWEVLEGWARCRASEV